MWDRDISEPNVSIENPRNRKIGNVLNVVSVRVLSKMWDFWFFLYREFILFLFFFCSIHLPTLVCARNLSIVRSRSSINIKHMHNYLFLSRHLFYVTHWPIILYELFIHFSIVSIYSSLKKKPFDHVFFRQLTSTIFIVRIFYFLLECTLWFLRLFY